MCSVEAKQKRKRARAHARTHARTHARARARTHTHTHAHTPAAVLGALHGGVGGRDADKDDEELAGEEGEARQDEDHPAALGRRGELGHEGDAGGQGDAHGDADQGARRVDGGEVLGEGGPGRGAASRARGRAGVDLDGRERAVGAGAARTKWRQGGRSGCGTRSPACGRTHPRNSLRTRNLP